MAVNPVSFPTFTPQATDFYSPLAQLGQQIKQNQNQASLAELGMALAQENPDYRAAAAKAAQFGSLEGVLKLTGMAEAQRKELEDRQSLASLGQNLGSLFGGQPAAAPTASPAAAAPAVSPAGTPRGIRNNNPLNIEAGGFTQGMPGFAGSDGRFAKFESPEQGVAAADRLLQTYSTKHGLNTVAGIVGRWAPASDGNNVSAYAQAVAKNMGVDPNQPLNMADPNTRLKLIEFMGQHENGRPIQMAFSSQSRTASDAPFGEMASLPPSSNAPAASAPPPASPQAQAPQPSNRLQQALPALLQGSMNPRLPQSARDTLKVLTEHALKQGDLTPDQKEYAQALSQGDPDAIKGFTPWMRANKAAGATKVSIDQQGETSFEKEFGKDQAKRWSGIIEQGEKAQRQLVDITSMREISNRIGSVGASAAAKEALGPYAEALGVNIEGLSDIQAYSSIVQRLAPQQRAPGSGSTSDVEFKGFLKSLPQLTQNPAARDATLNTMEALSRHDVAQAEIAQRLATKEINRTQAEKELRALPDPMASFREWRKANPQAYGQALKAGANAPAEPKAAQQPTPQYKEGDTATGPNGQRAIFRNGSWVVQ